MWLAQKMQPDTLNHALTMWDVDGELDSAVMASALRHVLGEAEVLRVNFVGDDGELRMAPRELGDWQPFFLDVSGEADPEQAAREALAEVVRRPFDLERDVLLRLGVVRLAPTRSLVVIAYHHLVSDGFGTGGLLSRRLAEVYTAMVAGSPIPELVHPWDVESFATEAQQYLDSVKFTEDTEFWREYLADAPPPAQIPRIPLSDSARAALEEPTGSADRWGLLAEHIGMTSRTLSVPRAEARAWTEAAGALGVWMSSLVTAAAAVYFRQRCDQPEVLFSLAVGNRIGVASRTPGLAVNVVPVRVKIPLGASFAEIADAVVDETYGIYNHGTCHYSDIQRASGAVLSGRANFGAVINVVEFAEELSFGGNPARYCGATTGTFDELSIGVYTDGTVGSDLYIRLDAPAGQYSGAELRFIGEDLIAHIRALVAAGAKSPVGALDVLTAAERDRVLAGARETAAQEPESTVAQRFARQAERTPEAVAVVDGELSVSYQELDERSGRVASVLRGHGAGPETVVAVALPRSANLVTALLAVAKAGAACLPIDPALPAERTRTLLAESSARLLLTDAARAQAASANLGVPVIVFEDAVVSATAASVVADQPASDGPELASVVTDQDSLFAVLQSSDSAAPVALTRRNMRRLVADGLGGSGAQTTVLWHAPYAADALALEVWAPLLSGGQIIVASAGESEVERLAELRAANGISRVWLPATSFSAIAADRPESLAGLREVWIGGGRVPAAAVQRAQEACPELTIVAAYGPAETAGYAASDRLTAQSPAYYAGAIGRPAQDTAVYVLGPGLAPVPVGVAGELYAAGPGVARGYQGSPGLTAQRFVPCPFGRPGGLMYRTGDRVRWTAEGRLDYLGRVQAPVAIHGTRVEPTEIEELIAEHPGVAQAVVLVHEDGAGKPRLAAYVARRRASGGSDSGGADPVSGEQLRRFAAERLPDSLVPSAFAVLDRLPVSVDGRVDRAALPQPSFDDGRYRAPRNHIEEVLAKAFAEVLELDRVGIDEDFFDLGGNSLRAIRLVGLIRAELNQELSIRTLFAARTVIGLSEKWEDIARTSRPALRRRTRDGALV